MWWSNEDVYARVHWKHMSTICSLLLLLLLSRISRVLCDPVDGSPPGSAIPGILQARTLEWVAISFSNARKWKVKVKSLSHVQLFVTPWTAAYQAPLSMGFSRQEYWSGLPLPSLIYVRRMLYFHQGYFSYPQVTFLLWLTRSRMPMAR